MSICDRRGMLQWYNSYEGFVTTVLKRCPLTKKNKKNETLSLHILSLKPQMGPRYLSTLVLLSALLLSKCVPPCHEIPCRGMNSESGLLVRIPKWTWDENGTDLWANGAVSWGGRPLMNKQHKTCCDCKISSTLNKQENILCNHQYEKRSFYQ